MANPYNVSPDRGSWSNSSTSAAIRSQNGTEHLFADSSVPAYDPAAAALLTERVLALLDEVEASEKAR